MTTTQIKDIWCLMFTVLRIRLVATFWGHSWLTEGILFHYIPKILHFTIDHLRSHFSRFCHNVPNMTKKCCETKLDYFYRFYSFQIKSSCSQCWPKMDQLATEQNECYQSRNLSTKILLPRLRNCKCEKVIHSIFWVSGIQLKTVRFLEKITFLLREKWT